MIRYLYAVLLVLVLSAGGVGALFWIQNSSRTTQLSLDLWFAAWQLTEPVTIPALIGLSFAGGLLVGGLLFAVPSSRNARKARRLEAKLATLGGDTEDAWRSAPAGEF